ncbi:hypothetical protein FPSE_11236 [Fusarium pseudograminearum CS3096]|uniref:Uncharacterized protein n=1 Tax=Fusarium pseudograminearum (strain CS3096) TaxID=1028729 RepID=K3VXB0_FUSPC|nr:hypothetical protein FPSE_11236 [Fusarium pseudograminearum CS3096]EKJ68585.1 hypothetical protein FPSE_11236 [Fusarium pseudograminearum CS3096]KAF0634635.1 hypothetical protein FPSE5266_11236 [Fusarium pseudograminearum]
MNDSASSSGWLEAPDSTLEVRMVAYLLMENRETFKTDPLAAATVEELASKNILNWSEFTMSYGMHMPIIDTAIATLNCEGIAAFFDFNSKLSHEQAVQFIREINIQSWDPVDLEPGFVQYLHEILCSNVDNGQSGDNESKLGDSLPKKNIGLFLFRCRRSFPSLDIHKDFILQEVKRILSACEEPVQSRPPTSPQSDLPMRLRLSRLVSYAEVHLGLSAIKAYLEVPAMRADKSLEELYGPNWVEVTSIESYVTKLSNTDDCKEALSLLELLGALKVYQYWRMKMDRALQSDKEDIMNEMMQSVELSDS